jgi:hypothetical protein
VGGSLRSHSRESHRGHTNLENNSPNAATVTDNAADEEMHSGRGQKWRAAEALRSRTREGERERGRQRDRERERERGRERERVRERESERERRGRGEDGGKAE